MAPTVTHYKKPDGKKWVPWPFPDSQPSARFLKVNTGDQCRNLNWFDSETLKEIQVAALKFSDGSTWELGEGFKK